MRHESNEVLIEIIKILPSLFWQLLLIILVIIYKKEIILFLGKIKKWSILGNDFELSNEIDLLQNKVEKIENNTPYNWSIADKKNEETSIKFQWEPKLMLIQIAIEIEKEIRKIMLSTWWSGHVNIVNIKQSFEFLIKNWSLPLSISSSIDIFLNIRNKIIHAHWGVSEDEILRMVDLWLSLLKNIQAIPHEINVVYKKDIDLFTDNKLSTKITNAKWLLLETTSPWEAIKSYRIFPTTKNDYIEWKIVSWEWSFDNQWWETYYKNPRYWTTEMAWSSSAEFIWRIID